MTKTHYVWQMENDVNELGKRGNFAVSLNEPVQAIGIHKTGSRRLSFTLKYPLQT